MTKWISNTKRDIASNTKYYMHNQNKNIQRVLEIKLSNKLSNTNSNTK
jgi:hypothetical protein